jgi:hypothetical protein
MLTVICTLYLVAVSLKYQNITKSNKQEWNLKNPNWNLYSDLLEEEIKKKNTITS